MNSNIFYLFFLSAFALLNNFFVQSFGLSDSDSDGFRLKLNEFDSKTDDEMDAFNRRLDDAVEVLNKKFEAEIVPQIPSLTEAIETAEKPKKLSEEKWNEIKEEKIKKLRERLYNKFSANYFRDYANFVTTEANEKIEDSMTKFGKKSIFDLSEESSKLAHDVANDLLAEAGASLPPFTPHKTRSEVKKEEKKKRKAEAKRAAKEAKEAQ